MLSKPAFYRFSSTCLINSINMSTHVRSSMYCHMHESTYIKYSLKYQIIINTCFIHTLYAIQDKCSMTHDHEQYVDGYMFNTYYYHKKWTHFIDGETFGEFICHKHIGERFQDYS